MEIRDTSSLNPYWFCIGIGLVLIAIGGVHADLPIVVTGLYLFATGGISIRNDIDWKPIIVLIGSVFCYTIVASYSLGILPPGAGLAIGLPLAVITLLIKYFSDAE